MTKELSSIIFEIYSFDWSFLYHPKILPPEILWNVFFVQAWYLRKKQDLYELFRIGKKF